MRSPEIFKQRDENSFRPPISVFLTDTPSEVEKLRRRGKELSAIGREAFSHRRSRPPASDPE
jgi:hypothetical protein